MSRDWTYIADILDAGQAIQNYLKDIDRDSFNDNALLQDAIQLRVIVIGEATNVYQWSLEIIIRVLLGKQWQECATSSSMIMIR